MIVFHRARAKILMFFLADVMLRWREGWTGYLTVRLFWIVLHVLFPFERNRERVWRIITNLHSYGP